ncbi:hypothetical protein F4813DRAFT_160010 [Daldinia decipiens]|uniref:uncharacterized protein n=1 Tax=Daldinia decipiens TaxID=326647 RepID=UPI0020C22C38|nr:uncharacterized protein F4813DRAFT_160010 [Daldinia decipiens]KAI1655460.1 hypothetical protein F4813DRAFT_160010 [Daldinia decipiens]
MDQFEREALFNEDFTQIKDRSEEYQDSNNFTKDRYTVFHIINPCIVIPWLLVVVLSIINLLLLAKVHNQNGTVIATEALYSPVEHLIRHEERLFQSSLSPNLTPYQGAPSLEVDGKWEELYLMGDIAISSDEAGKLLNQTATIRNDPQGRYIINIDVFHSLHCLHSLRKVVYSEYYLAGSAATAKKPPGFDVNHLDHCVDHLRQSLMCGVDISVMPFEVV